MSLFWTVVAAYVVGRALTNVGSIILKVLTRRLVERSSTLRRWILQDNLRDRRLKDAVRPY